MSSSCCTLFFYNDPRAPDGRLAPSTVFLHELNPNAHKFAFSFADFHEIQSKLCATFGWKPAVTFCICKPGLKMTEHFLLVGNLQTIKC